MNNSTNIHIQYKLLVSFVFIFMLIIPNCFAQNFWLELSLPDNMEISSIAYNKEGEIFAINKKTSELFVSKDNGYTWTLMNTPKPCIWVYVDSEDEIFISSSQVIFHSSDNGSTWNNISAINDYFEVMMVVDNMIFLTALNGIYKTDDFGITWHHVHEDYTSCNYITSMLYAGEGYFFAGVTSWMGGWGMFRSKDNGDTWSHIGLIDDYVTSLCIDSKVVIYAGSHGNHYSYQPGIYKSTDLGTTWVSVNNQFRSFSLVIDENDILYSLSEIGVLRSDDGGKNWEPVDSDISFSENYRLSLSNTGYLYAFYEKSFYRSKDVVVADIYNSEIQEKILNVYPNPFTEKLQIDGLASDRATISISDIQGREVYRGIYMGDAINLSHLLPGVYILNVKADGKSGAYKIVKSMSN